MMKKLSLALIAGLFGISAFATEQTADYTLVQGEVRCENPRDVRVCEWDYGDGSTRPVYYCYYVKVCDQK